MTLTAALRAAIATPSDLEPLRKMSAREGADVAEPCDLIAEITALAKNAAETPVPLVADGPCLRTERLQGGTPDASEWGFGRPDSARRRRRGVPHRHGDRRRGRPLRRRRPRRPPARRQRRAAPRRPWARLRRRCHPHHCDHRLGGRPRSLTMPEWTPTCEALPPVGARCVGLYEDGEFGEPIAHAVRLTADHDRASASWMIYSRGAWSDAYPPRVWALLPAIPDEWASPCPAGGEIVDYEANVCSCGRVGGVAR